MKLKLKLSALFLIIFIVLTSCTGEGEKEETEQAVTANPTVTVEQTEQDRVPVVMVDPGHGFGDVGTTSDYLGSYEKDINLAVALKLKEKLEAKGVEVILTHDGESFINETELLSTCDSLGIEYKPEAVVENDLFYAYERALFAMIKDAEVGIDMFVSLHVNAIELEYINGYQIFYCSDHPESKKIEALCNDIAAALDNKCDIKSYDKDNAYIVTKYGTYPSFLFEMGYATNTGDAEKLKDEQFQDQLADILCEKIYASITSAAE